MPEILLQSVGTGDTSTGSISSPTTRTPGLPATRPTGSVLICLTTCRTPAATATISAGWSELFVRQGANGKIYVFGCVVDGSETAPTITWTGQATGNSGGPQFAQIACWSNVATSGGVPTLDVVGAVSDQAASTTAAAGGAAITTANPGAAVVTCSSRQDDAGTWATLAASDTITWAKVAATLTSTGGADGAQEWQWGVRPAAGSVAAKTFTISGGSSFASSGVMFALQPIPAIEVARTGGAVAVASAGGEQKLGIAKAGGGRVQGNVLSNPDFENGSATPWTHNGVPAASLTASTDHARSGTRSLKFTTPDAGNFSIFSEAVRLDVAPRSTLSIRTPNGARTVIPKFQLLNASGTPLASVYAGEFTTDSTRWVDDNQRAHNPSSSSQWANARSLRLEIQINGLAAAESLYLDDVAAEMGATGGGTKSLISPTTYVDKAGGALAQGSTGATKALVLAKTGGVVAIATGGAPKAVTTVKTGGGVVPGAQGGGTKSLSYPPIVKTGGGQATTSAGGAKKLVAARYGGGHLKGQGLPNPSFETDLSGWESATPDVTELSRTTEQAFDGVASARLRNTATSAQALEIRSNLLPLTAGGSFRTTAYFRSATTPRSARLTLTIFDADGAQIGQHFPGFITTSTTEWVRHRQSWTVTAPGAAFIKISAWVTNTEVNEVHYVDLVSYEVGAQAGGTKSVVYPPLDKTGGAVAATQAGGGKTLSFQGGFEKQGAAIAGAVGGGSKAVTFDKSSGAQAAASGGGAKAITYPPIDRAGGAVAPAEGGGQALISVSIVIAKTGGGRAVRGLI